MKHPPHINLNRSIFLPGNVPSSKNNREIGFYFLKPEDESSWYIKRGTDFKKIRPTLQSSDRTKEYVKNIVDHIIANRQKFLQLVKGLPKPYIIQFYFVRDSRRSFDFINACQIIADCMTGHYWTKHPKIPHAATIWVADDNMDELIMVPPLTGSKYMVDKENPGVWITVLQPGVVMNTDSIPEINYKEILAKQPLQLFRTENHLDTMLESLPPIVKKEYDQDNRQLIIYTQDGTFAIKPVQID